MSTKGSRVPHQGVGLPVSVQIKGEFVLWNYPEQPQFRRPTDRTLISFSKLADAPDSIPDFALRSGTLQAFQIKKSEHRDRSCIELQDGTIWSLGNTFPTSGKEPIALWNLLAARFRAILRINAALRGRTHNPLPTSGTPADWEALGLGGPPFEHVRDAQFFLRGEVESLLALGGVRLNLGTLGYSESKTDWTVFIDYDGLIGGLAYRLLLMVVGESRLYACDGCGTPYVRTKRAPRLGQENFCDDCQDEAGRRASRRWKERNRK